MEALDRYLALNLDDVSCLITKFLNLYFTDSPYLEPYEVDNFILRNGRFLALWYVLSRIDVLLTSPSVVPGNLTMSSVLRYQAFGLPFYHGRWLWMCSHCRPLYIVGSFRIAVGSDGTSATKCPNDIH